MHLTPPAPLTSDSLFGLREGHRILAVVSHPDDETIGPGGLLHRAATAGITVDVLAVACRTRPMWGGHSDPTVRAKEFDAACDALGVSGRIIAWVDDEHAHAPGNHASELVSLIESGTDVSMAATRPDLMLIPSATGFHQDHLAVHHAGLAAARLGGNAKPTPRIVLGYCGPEDIWTRTVEPWTALVDTTGSWPAKEQALRAHASQLRDWPHPRSIEGIRTLDAATGLRLGTPLAEQFVAYRIAC